MNKHLFFFLVLVSASLFSMEKTIYNRIANSAQKKDVETDLTFEQAKSAIDKECQTRHLKYWLIAFARTYLRMEKQKNYNQIKKELDLYCCESPNDILTSFFVSNFVSIMKKAIDNWDTQDPQNIFKYVGDNQGILNFLEDDYFLGLKNPYKAKDKQQ